MLGGIEYRRITPEGLVVAQDGVETLLPADTIVLCTGQEPLRALLAPLQDLGVSVHVIGGADAAGELDAKRAIDQGARVAAKI